MIELLLRAERALAMGMVDQAEGLYRQAADADPKNSIAVVGLARVALERADDAGALQEAWRALEIDPENVAASRLAARLEEVLAYRGEALPPTTAAEPEPIAAEPEPNAAEPEPNAAEPEPNAAEPEPNAAEPRVPGRSITDRLLRRNNP